MWTLSEYNNTSIASLHKASLGRVLHDRVFTVKAGRKSVWRRKSLLFQHVKHGAGCLHTAWKLRDIALGTPPVASISSAWRGVSQWLVNPEAAVASGLPWQPRGYGHRLWMLSHTAWLLGSWLIPYQQLTLALCQCFFRFRKHRK